MKCFSYLLISLLLIGNSCAEKSSDIAKKLHKGEPILIQNETIDTSLILSKLLKGFTTNNNVTEYRTSSSVTFIDCIFTKEIMSKEDKSSDLAIPVFEKNLSFIGCTFQEEVDLSHVQIFGRTDFSGSIFKKKANFSNASFKGSGVFSNASFENDVKFQNTIFNENTTFAKCEFLGNASFKATYFRHTSSFGVAKFFEYADFGLATFKEKSNFSYTIFSKRSNFGNSTFEKTGIFNSTSFNESNFQRATFFMPLEFSEVKIETKISFENHKLIMGELRIDTKESADQTKILYLNR